MTYPAGPGSAIGVTIRVFLVDGTPQGMRLVDRTGWTGSCLAFNRSEYASARERKEFSRTGVYVLIGDEPDGSRDQRVYIGEGETVRSRIDSHHKDKDFWTRGYVLTTKDDSLNKAHGRYLEARLISVATAADNAVLDNGTAPKPQQLTEFEEADMEAYLREVLTLLPLVGVNVFDVVPASPPPLASQDGPALGDVVEPLVPDRPSPELHLNTDLTHATGREDPRGFVVYAGALGRREKKVMMRGYEQLRERLIAERVLAAQGDDQYRLAKDYVFDSPSAAASVLSGGNKNGRTEWRDENNVTLKELQKAAATPVVRDEP